MQIKRRVAFDLSVFIKHLLSKNYAAITDLLKGPFDYMYLSVVHRDDGLPFAHHTTLKAPNQTTRSPPEPSIQSIPDRSVDVGKLWVRLLLIAPFNRQPNVSD